MTIRPRKVNPVSLGIVADKFNLLVPTLFEVSKEELTQQITGVTHDSRQVVNGDVYFAMPGAKFHGAQFYSQAKSQGAVAVLTDAQGFEMIQADADFDQRLPVLVSEKNPRKILGEVAAYVYDNEHTGMLLFGITGTNGKTSTIYLLDALLQLAALKRGISSTAERRIGETVVESDLTSPEASELHALIAAMAEQDVEAVAVEVSAQAVVRNRIDGVLFDVVSFNNLSQDHLDDFGDMENYFQAKLALFTPERAKKGVVVVDTKEGQRVAKESTIPVVTLATEYGQEADWHLAVTRHSVEGVSFVLQGPDDMYLRARVPVFGEFMAENAAIAFIMLVTAGVNVEPIIAKLKKDDLKVDIPGRLELISNPDQGPRFYVDYGHTPGSFKSMLEALNEVKTGRIIFMFGADGDRDTTKREEMGRIASEGADVLIICDYHPRFEDPAQIRRQLLEGAESAKHPAQINEIADPREAVRFAIKNATENDIIVYAGPGHETYQEVAGNMIPYSARDEVRGALREAGFEI